MSIVAVVAALALAALFFWKVGAALARFGGALLVVISLVLIVAGDSIAERGPALLAGVIVWLAGHFLSAYQGRCWRSRLAETIVVRTPLRYLDPVHGRELREVRRAAREEDADDEEQVPVSTGHFAQWEHELTDDAAPVAAPRRRRRAARRTAPARSARPSRGVVYGKRAAKTLAAVAARKVPGGRAARSAWRFLR